jgi:hypothetical protein
VLLLAGGGIQFGVVLDFHFEVELAAVGGGDGALADEVRAVGELEGGSRWCRWLPLSGARQQLRCWTRYPGWPVEMIWASLACIAEQALGEAADEILGEIHRGVADCGQMLVERCWPAGRNRLCRVGTGRHRVAGLAPAAGLVLLSFASWHTARRAGCVM